MEAGVGFEQALGFGPHLTLGRRDVGTPAQHLRIGEALPLRVLLAQLFENATTVLLGKRLLLALHELLKLTTDLIENLTALNHSALHIAELGRHDSEHIGVHIHRLADSRQILPAIPTDKHAHDGLISHERLSSLANDVNHRVVRVGHGLESRALLGYVRAQVVEGLCVWRLDGVGIERHPLLGVGDEVVTLIPISLEDVDSVNTLLHQASIQDSATMAKG